MSLLRSVAFCTLTLTVLGSVAAIAGPRADVVVSLDEAKLMRLPDKIATLVIGNPLIADASLQTGGQMVITGRGYGMTNIIALDRAGNVLMDKNIEVQGPAGHVVVVYRGSNAKPTAARRIANAGSRSATALLISIRSSCRATSAPARRRATKRLRSDRELPSRRSR